MYWRLTDSITACIACDRVLFLDIARDRYFALPDDCNDQFASWLAGPEDGESPSRHREILVGLGILDPFGATDIRPVACTAPSTEPLDAAPLAPKPIDLRNLFGVGLVVASAARDVRSGRFAAVLGRRLARLRFDAPAAVGEMMSRLAEFRTVRPFIPVPRVCLHDCLALIEWMGPSRAGAQLVFGVTAYPFAAHCWVQAGGRILDDHPESASRFEPILLFP